MSTLLKYNFILFIILTNTIIIINNVQNMILSVIYVFDIGSIIVYANNRLHYSLSAAQWCFRYT